MANIKMCPRCCGRPRVIHTRRGYIWRHKCKSFDEELEFTSKPFDKFGDMVRDWNTRVKRVKEIYNYVHMGESFAEGFSDGIRKVEQMAIEHPRGEVLK